MTARGVVHFKFKSGIHPDKVEFDGAFVSVGELKALIAVKKNLGKDASAELVLTDSQTKAKYADDAQLLPRNTAVIVSRLPSKLPRAHQHRPGIASSTTDSQQPSTDGAAGPADEFGTDPYASQPVAPLGEDEEAQALQRLLAGQAEKWEKDVQAGGRGRGRGGRFAGRGRFGASTGPPGAPAIKEVPPPSYICNRCGKGGHYIQDCPTQEDPEHTKRYHRPRGIPMTRLGHSENGGLILPDGSFGSLVPNEDVFLREMGGVPSTSKQPAEQPGVGAVEPAPGSTQPTSSTAIAPQPAASLSTALVPFQPTGTSAARAAPVAGAPLQLDNKPHLFSTAEPTLAGADELFPESFADASAFAPKPKKQAPKPSAPASQQPMPLLPPPTAQPVGVPPLPMPFGPMAPFLDPFGGPEQPSVLSREQFEAWQAMERARLAGSRHLHSGDRSRSRSRSRPRRRSRQRSRRSRSLSKSRSPERSRHRSVSPEAGRREHSRRERSRDAERAHRSSKHRSSHRDRKHSKRGRSESVAGSRHTSPPPAASSLVVPPAVPAEGAELAQRTRSQPGRLGSRGSPSVAAAPERSPRQAAPQRQPLADYVTGQVERPAPKAQPAPVRERLPRSPLELSSRERPFSGSRKTARAALAAVNAAPSDAAPRPTGTKAERAADLASLPTASRSPSPAQFQDLRDLLKAKQKRKEARMQPEVDDRWPEAAEPASPAVAATPEQRSASRSGSAPRGSRERTKGSRWGPDLGAGDQANGAADAARDSVEEPPSKRTRFSPTPDPAAAASKTLAAVPQEARASPLPKMLTIPMDDMPATKAADGKKKKHKRDKEDRDADGKKPRKHKEKHGRKRKDRTGDDADAAPAASALPAAQEPAAHEAPDVPVLDADSRAASGAAPAAADAGAQHAGEPAGTLHDPPAETTAAAPNASRPASPEPSAAAERPGKHKRSKRTEPADVEQPAATSPLAPQSSLPVDTAMPAELSGRLPEAQAPVDAGGSLRRTRSGMRHQRIERGQPGQPEPRAEPAAQLTADKAVVERSKNSSRKGHALAAVDAVHAEDLQPNAVPVRERARRSEKEASTQQAQCTSHEDAAEPDMQHAERERGSSKRAGRDKSRSGGLSLFGRALSGIAQDPLGRRNSCEDMGTAAVDEATLVDPPAAEKARADKPDNKEKHRSKKHKKHKHHSKEKVDA